MGACIKLVEDIQTEILRGRALEGQQGDHYTNSNVLCEHTNSTRDFLSSRVLHLDLLRIICK